MSAMRRTGKFLEIVNETDINNVITVWKKECRLAELALRTWNLEHGRWYLELTVAYYTCSFVTTLCIVLFREPGSLYFLLRSKQLWGSLHVFCEETQIWDQPPEKRHRRWWNIEGTLRYLF